APAEQLFGPTPTGGLFRPGLQVVNGDGVRILIGAGDGVRRPRSENYGLFAPEPSNGGLVLLHEPAAFCDVRLGSPLDQPRAVLGHHELTHVRFSQAQALAPILSVRTFGSRATVGEPHDPRQNRRQTEVLLLSRFGDLIAHESVIDLLRELADRLPSGV